MLVVQSARVMFSTPSRCSKDLLSSLASFHGAAALVSMSIPRCSDAGAGNNVDLCKVCVWYLNETYVGVGAKVNTFVLDLLGNTSH